MNSVYQSILLMKNQLLDVFAYSFSNEIKIPTRQMKVVSIAALVFALLSLLVYKVYRWHGQRKITLQDKEEVDTVQNIALEKLKIKKQADSPEKMKIKKQVDSPEALTKISKESSPVLPIVKEIPPMPRIKYVALFKELAHQTALLPITTLPYTYANCRFKDILCPKETMVQVPGSTTALYLHANHVYLEGVHFILTQYPYPIQMPLFWRASKEACLILDLTNEKDIQKGLISYAPELHSQAIFSKENEETIVRCLKQQALEGINAKLYTYSFDENDPIFGDSVIARLHYEDWDDHKGITEDDLDRIIAIFEQYQKDPNTPILIHCRAGVGRSGTVSVVYAISQLIKQNKVNASNLNQYINDLILEGRKQRGDGFVQTPEQLKAIWRWSWRAVHRAQ